MMPVKQKYRPDIYVSTVMMPVIRITCAHAQPLATQIGSADYV